MLYCIALLTVLLLPSPCALQAEEDIKCAPGNETCSECYSMLVSQVTKNDRNVFNLQNGFFPPEASSPLFLTVYYHFGNHSDVCNTTEIRESLQGDTKNDVTKVWFWSTTTFYLFQPLHVFQFTSLYFSDFKPYASEVCIVLDPECYDANDAHIRLLTQRVS